MFKEVLFRATNAALNNSSQDLATQVSVMTGLIVLLFFIAIFLLVFLVYWVYSSFAWYSIAKKLKYKHPFMAWIPFARAAMILQMAGYHWAWVFLYLIPLLGWFAIFILLLACTWKIYEKRRYSGWWALLPLFSALASSLTYLDHTALLITGQLLSTILGILNLVILGLVAWKDRKKSK